MINLRVELRSSGSPENLLDIQDIDIIKAALLGFVYLCPEYDHSMRRQVDTPS